LQLGAFGVVFQADRIIRTACLGTTLGFAIRTTCLGTTLGFATLGDEHRWVCPVIFFVIIVDRRTRAHLRLAVRRLLAQEPVGQSL